MTRLHRDAVRHERLPSVEVVLCEGCGAAAGRPDAAAAAERLRHAAGRAPVPTRVRDVDCLAVCPLGPAVVVRRHEPRAAGGRSRTSWFALVTGDDVVDALAAWVAAGASHPPPDVARRHAMPVPCGRVPG